MGKNLPLKGTTVIELGTYVAVPNAARFLADWGADVIKVESTSGDPFRYMGANHHCPITDEENPFFDHNNANKRLVAINLKDPEGMAAMERLLDKADIFLSNVRMKSLTKMGLDGDTLLSKYPKLVYGHFTGYGDVGPDSDLPGFDSVAFWARSGMYADWPMAGDTPFLGATGAGDTMSGMIFAMGVLAAYVGALNTGKGTIVSNSLYGSAIWYNAAHVMSTQFGNKLPLDKNQPNNPLGFPYECKDGEWLYLGLGNYKKDFPIFCKAIGHPEFIGDERFTTIKELQQNRDFFMPMIRSVFKSKNRDEWVSILAGNDLVCGKVEHVKNIATDPQALENKYIRKISYPNGDVVGMPGVPVKMSSYDDYDYKLPGKVGSSTDDVMKDFGYTEEEIAELKSKGVIK